MTTKNMVKGLSMALILTIGLSVNSIGQTSNNNGLIGRAHSADGVANAIADAQGNGYQVNSYVETTGICFVSGALNRVVFYAGPRLNPNEIYPMRYMLRLVATVDFGCDGEIIGSSLNGQWDFLR